MMERRVKFADFVLELRHNANWFSINLVWANSIVPLNEKKANQMALARKWNKGWMSPGSELSSANLKGHPEALKQKKPEHYEDLVAPNALSRQASRRCVDGNLQGKRRKVLQN